MNPGKYGKLWMYIVGAGLTVLSARYGGTTWMPYVVGAAGAAGVYGVPNAPNMLAIKGETSITHVMPHYSFERNTNSPSNPVTAPKTPEPSPDIAPMAQAPESP